MPDTKKSYFEDWPDDIPPALQSTVALLEEAFPDGVSQSKFEPLLVLLGEGMSYRQIGKLLSLSEGRSKMNWYNVIVKAQENKYQKRDEALELVDRIGRESLHEWLSEGEMRPSKKTLQFLDLNR